MAISPKVWTVVAGLAVVATVVVAFRWGRSTSVVEEPASTITLEQAMASVGRSFSALQAARISSARDFHLARLVEACRNEQAAKTEPSVRTAKDPCAPAGFWTKANEAAEAERLGLIPKEVTVSFAIAASASGKGQLGVDFSHEAAGKASAIASREAAANRGNTISITLVNPLLASPKDSILGAKSSKEVQELLGLLGGGEFQWFVAAEDRPDPGVTG